MRALPHRDAAGGGRDGAGVRRAPVVKLAFEFFVFTAAMSGEVRGARWAETDTEDHVWTVPAKVWLFFMESYLTHS